MKDLMLDFETYGTSFNAVVVQIGACYFDRYEGTIGDTFLINIDPTSEIRHGFTKDQATLDWWSKQSKEAQDSIKVDPVTSVEAFTKFNDFIKKAKQVWSHATFDFVIMQNHFNVLNIKPKVHYRSARDIRTLTDLVKVDYKKVVRVGISHNALDDCLYQVAYCSNCLKALKGDK